MNFANLFNHDLTKKIINTSLIIIFGKFIQVTFLFVLAGNIEATTLTFFVSSLAFSNLLALFVIPGGQQGLTVALSKILQNKKYDEFLSYTTLCFIIFIVFTLSIIFIMISITYIFNLEYLAQHLKFLPVSLLTIFIIFRISVTRALGLINRSLINYEVISPLILLIITISNISHLNESLHLIWFWVYFCLEIITIILCLNSIKIWALSKSYIYKFNKIDNKSILIQLSNIFRLLIIRSDILIVSFLLGPNVAAPYALAQRLVQPITIFGRIFNSSTTPSLVKYVELKIYTKLNDFKKIGKIYSIFVFISILFFYIVAFRIGYDYFNRLNINTLVVGILFLSQALIFFMVPITQFLLFSSHTKSLLYNYLFWAIFMIVNIYIFKNILTDIFVASLVLISVAGSSLTLMLLHIYKFRNNEY